MTADISKQKSLSYEDIIRVTSGAVRTAVTENGIEFNRLNLEQEKYYEYSERYYNRGKCSAGIIMRFETDSASLTVVSEVSNRSSAPFFTFDVLVNGKYFDCLSNCTEEEILNEDTSAKGRFGEFQKTFRFPDGIKQIEVYFPYNQMAVIKQILVDCDSYIKPLKYGKKALIYGDSISQGYSCFHSSKTFISNVCRFLEAEQINKAIAGEGFKARFAEFKDEIEPSYIFVAYGTNDWKSNRGKEEIENQCRNFCLNLRKNYPDVPIFFITPIWRKEADEILTFCSFYGLEELLSNAVSTVNNVFVISGINLVPHDVNMYSDLRLHPNGKGFSYYTENLINELKNRNLIG